MNRHSLIALAVAALFIAACGGSSPAQSSEAAPAAGQTVVVATAPVETSVVPGTSVRFTAQVTGTADTSVRWSVDEADGGTIDAAGLYTAPAIEGTFHVTAEQGSQAAAASPTTGASKRSAGKSVVHVSKAAAPVIAISISPTTVTLDACKGQVFTASVTNSSNTAATWTITEAGGGTVTAGSYVAPTTPGTYHVVAASQADPSKTATATVTVEPEKVLSVAVNPGSGTVQANGQLAFAATVTTTCGTFAAQ